jgi:hypothetical protein
MTRLSRIVVTFIVAGLLLLLADKIFEPVPIPAATATLGALVASWSSRGTPGVRLVAGLVVGALTGAGMHAFVHLTGRSTLPEEGVPAHVAADGILGLAVGGLVALAALSAWALLSRGR